MGWLSGLFGGSKKSQIIAYKYSLGMQMVPGYCSMDALEKIKVGEKVVWEESNVLKDSLTTLVGQVAGSPHIWKAQTFTATSDYTLSAIGLQIGRFVGRLPGIITVSIRAVDGGGTPIGEDLCFGTIDGDTEIVESNIWTSYDWEIIEFNNPIILESGTKYTLILRSTEQAGDNGFQIILGDSYLGGSMWQTIDDGVNWSAISPGWDILFKCYTTDGSAPNQTITIDSPNIFGGDKKEGGVSGDVDLMFGKIDQTQNDYLKARLDSDIPAFRGLFSAVLNQVYIGTSAYLKPWSFFLKRCNKQISGSDQWYSEKSVLRPREESGDDLNAIHIIRECLIDSEWGLNFDATDDIDDDYFKEAANILFDEGFGLSMSWDQESAVEDFVNEVLNYIAGILYQDLETGKWRITLTRDPDYETPYDYYNTGDNNQGMLSTATNAQFAQTFMTSRNYSSDTIKIKCYKAQPSGTFDVRVELQSLDSNRDPSGTVLAQGIILAADISTSAAWTECTLDAKVDLTVNSRYALVVYPINGSGVFYWRVAAVSGGYMKGFYIVSNDGGGTWTKVNTNDFMFEIYAGADLETFNEDDIISIDEFVRPTPGEIINVVTVNWWDKINCKSRPAPARDLALIEKQGGAIIEKSLNYQGICNPTLANKVAERELKLVTAMLAGMRIKATRKLAHLKPNDIFTLSWDALNITSMVVRVMSINYGNLNKNEIYMKCVEDIFSAVDTIYGDAPDTLWADSVTNPADATNLRLIEIPYWVLVNEIAGSVSIIDALDDDAGALSIVAEKPSEDSFDYDVHTRLSASYNFEDVGQGNVSFTPTAVLTNNLAMAAADIVVDLSSESDLDLIATDTYAIINDEIIRILSIDISNMQIEIARGILDTVPAAHSAGDRIYFMKDNFGETGIEYTNADQPRVKILPRTANGSLAIASATEQISGALNSRMIRPYPPGNLKFNGESYPNFFSSGANGNKIAITWSHRDRTDEVQLNSLVKHTTATDYGPEAGTTYTIEIYDADNVLRRTYSGLSGTSQDYTEATEISDCGSLQGQLRFVIYSVRAGYDSFVSYDITLRRSFRGTITAVSTVNGDISTYFERNQSTSATSSADGNLKVSKKLTGSSDATSGADGNINSQKPLKGSADGSSGADGDLTV